MEDINMEALRETFALDVAEFLNIEFGRDLSNLDNAKDVLDRITKYEKYLDSEINPHSNDANHMIMHSRNVNDALERVREVIEKHENLQKLIDSELDKMEPLKVHFSYRIQELKEVKCLYNYLQCVLKIEDENSRMEEVMKNEFASHIVNSYIRFRGYWEKLQTSQCKNLVEYARKTLLYWHDILKEKFGREFKKILGNLHWPVLSANISLPLNQSPDLIMKFNELFLSLHKIALPFESTKDVKEGIEDTSLLIPIQLMLQPLQKRFVFHFMGKKPTNRLDKPEWYLTQILTWISEHTFFVENSVQPILDNEGPSHINARAQLMKGLVHLAIVRLKSDFSCLLDDDRLLSHTIDEILLFSQELQNQGYPLSYPNVIHLLTTEFCFSRWRALEHQSALEKMDRFLSLETAFKSRFQDESDLDDMQVPESAELFVTLLLTMTERYCNLNDKDCQLSFLELQLELLDDFRLRLHQLSQHQMQEPNQANYCGIMNAIHYVITILEEWNNLPFFLQLHAYKKKRSTCKELLGVKRKENKPVLQTEDEIVESSVFDDALGLFRHILRDLLQTLCDRVMLDVKAKSRPYRKEKWFCMPLTDKKSMEVSFAAYPMLEVINTSMHSLQELLAKPLFTKVWQQVAMDLNVYIYEEVILQNNFSEGGAAQLNFDMARNLFPIFGIYTLKPDSYFKLVRDSCILLNLSNAPAMLLRETLKCQESFEAKNNALEELGVYGLSPSQALIILLQRNFANL